jgi:hypothetical protein
MSAEQKARLDALGFVWSAKNDTSVSEQVPFDAGTLGAGSASQSD